MALQTSGAISLNDIHIEAGGASGTTASLNDADIRGLIGKASGSQMSFSEWYGASSAFESGHAEVIYWNNKTDFMGYNYQDGPITSKYYLLNAVDTPIAGVAKTAVFLGNFDDAGWPIHLGNIPYADYYVPRTALSPSGYSIIHPVGSVGALYGFNSSGSLVWSKTVSGMSFTYLAHDETNSGYCYAEAQSGSNSYLFKIEFATGNIAWAKNLGSSPAADPYEVNGTLVGRLNSTDGTIHKYNKSDGSLASSVQYQVNLSGGTPFTGYGVMEAESGGVACGGYVTVNKTSTYALALRNSDGSYYRRVTSGTMMGVYPIGRNTATIWCGTNNQFVVKCVNGTWQDWGKVAITHKKAAALGVPSTSTNIYDGGRRIRNAAGSEWCRVQAINEIVFKPDLWGIFDVDFYNNNIPTYNTIGISNTGTWSTFASAGGIGNSTQVNLVQSTPAHSVSAYTPSVSTGATGLNTSSVDSSIIWNAHYED